MRKTDLFTNDFENALRLKRSQDEPNPPEAAREMTIHDLHGDGVERETTERVDESQALRGANTVDPIETEPVSQLSISHLVRRAAAKPPAT